MAQILHRTIRPVSEKGSERRQILKKGLAYSAAVAAWLYLGWATPLSKALAASPSTSGDSDEITGTESEKKAVALVRHTYKEVIKRRVPDFKPVAKTFDSRTIVSFEVRPESIDRATRFYFNHLAVFVVEGDKVIAAAEIARIPKSNTEILVRDLDSNETHTITVKEPLPELPSIPESTIPQKGKDGDVSAQGAWICVEWDRGGGDHNNWCLILLCAPCAAMSGALAAACALACGTACWIPSYEVCVRWEWSDYPMP